MKLFRLSDKLKSLKREEVKEFFLYMFESSVFKDEEEIKEIKDFQASVINECDKKLEYIEDNERLFLAYALKVLEESNNIKGYYYMNNLIKSFIQKINDYSVKEAEKFTQDINNTLYHDDGIALIARVNEFKKYYKDGEEVNIGIYTLIRGKNGDAITEICEKLIKPAYINRNYLKQIRRLDIKNVSKFMSEHEQLVEALILYLNVTLKMQYDGKFKGNTNKVSLLYTVSSIFIKEATIIKDVDEKEDIVMKLTEEFIKILPSINKKISKDIVV